MHIINASSTWALKYIWVIGKWVLAEGLSTSNNQKGVPSAVFTNTSGFFLVHI